MSRADAIYLLFRTILAILATTSASVVFWYAIRAKSSSQPWKLALCGAVFLTLAACLSIFDGIYNAFLEDATPIILISWWWLVLFDMPMPIISLLLLRAWYQRDEAEARLAKLAVTDALTGLLNRRGFIAQANTAIDRARRAGSPVSVAMFDIDRFKSINDGFGHDTGDRVLREFGACLSAQLRAGDVIGRVGGEEFALLAIDADAEKALASVERVRDAVRRDVAHPAGDPKQVTVSAGVACLDDTDDSLESALIRADGALYRAKESGRDRALIAGRERVTEPALS